MASDPTTSSPASWPTYRCPTDQPLLPTRRLLALFLLSAATAAIPDVGRLLAAVVALLSLAAALLDWQLSRVALQLTAERQVEPKLSLAEWNVVGLALTNPTRRPMDLELRDVPPAEFHVEARIARLRTPARGSISYTERVRPTHRGDYVFGNAWIRVCGPLGLVRRQLELTGTSQLVKVYPSLKQLRRYDLLVRRGLISEAGSNAVRKPGSSLELERLRDYLPDDDFRRINWKATARRGRPIVNEFEAERGQNVVLMLDAGRLMSAPATNSDTPLADALLQSDVAPGLAKLDYALNAAMLLAYVASLRGDRVALLAYADQVRLFLPPARGRPAFLRVVDALYNLEPEPVEPDHALAFQFLASRSIHRSLAVLFTDVPDRESSRPLVAHVLRAARRHYVVCVTLGDPTISRPAQASPTDGPSLYEKMVAQQLLDDRQAVLAAMAAQGVYTRDTDADKLSPKLIDAYLELKQRGRV